MEPDPVIVSVSALRRQTAALIETAIRDEVPVFITQNGFGMAVLLSQAEYRKLLRARECAPGSPDPPVRQRVSGPTWIKISEDRTALCDPELAEMLLEEGHEIDPGPGRG